MTKQGEKQSKENRPNKKNIAIIGASPKSSRYSNMAVRAYVKAGYNVFPVNPREKEINGIRCFQSLKEIKSRIDIVSMYVRGEIGRHYINEIISRGVPLVILNPGSEDDEIIRRLEEKNIEVRRECSLKVVREARGDEGKK